MKGKAERRLTVWTDTLIGGIMKKLTMQEFADFFECYVAKDETGVVFAYETKPNLYKYEKEDMYYWGNQYYDYFNVIYLISDATTHDYRILVEPHKKKKEEVQ